MPKLRILLVDDEPLARERLRVFLRDEADAEIVGECGSGADAIAAVRASAPDLMFLDMEMPGGCGLEVLAELGEAQRPAVIFATAHECFALDAFEVQAVDYLLKPFDRDRLKLAVRRARDFLKARRAGDLGDRLEALLAQAGAPAPTGAPMPPPPAGVEGAVAAPGSASADAARKPERITVKADGRLVFLRSEDIVWVEAADNYVILHLVDGRLMVRETMAALEARLGSANFARVSRSAIVHLDQIKELQPTPHGDYTVLLRTGAKVPLSRALRGQLDKFTGGPG